MDVSERSVRGGGGSYFLTFEFLELIYHLVGWRRFGFTGPPRVLCVIFEVCFLED